MAHISDSKLPVHVGFIMDGNGRWAQKRGLPRQLGHKEGAKVFRKIARYCKDIGIKYVTFFAFSTENWNRPKKRLMQLCRCFSSILIVDDYADENTFAVLGEKSAFNQKNAKRMTELEKSRNRLTE